MKQIKVFSIILMIISFSCKSQTIEKENVAVNFLNNHKICFTSYNKTKNCLNLNDKFIYISENKNNQYIDYFLLPNKKREFSLLSNNRKNVITQFDTLKNEFNIFYNELRFKKTTEIKNADLILQVSPIIIINGYDFIFITIRENKTKLWGIKLKIKDNRVIASEIIQILD